MVNVLASRSAAVVSVISSGTGTTKRAGAVMYSRSVPGTGKNATRLPEIGLLVMEVSCGEQHLSATH